MRTRHPSVGDGWGNSPLGRAASAGYLSAMRIEDVIRKKGREVVTVAPESTVAELEEREKVLKAKNLKM